MAKSYEVLTIADKINRVLDFYIAIHEDLFRLSIRRVIPLPGLFKPIDYKTHCEYIKGLDDIKVDILEIIKSKREERHNKNELEYIGALENYYLPALFNAINKLYDICFKLYLKSEQEKPYSKMQYKKDIEEYKDAVNRYVELGSSLNELYENI